MESQWIPNLKPAAFVELCSLNELVSKMIVWRNQGEHENALVLYLAIVVKGIALEAVGDFWAFFFQTGYVNWLIYL